MSTATARDSVVPLLEVEKHFLLRRLHSLTGILFGGYLVVHLMVNATIVQMGDVYQVQVSKIHSLPMLPAIEWTFIFIPIIYHLVYGLWITITGQPNNAHYGYAKNWFYLFQRISAVVLVLFIVFHVISLKYGLCGMKLSFDPEHATSTIHRHMTAHWWVAWIVYPIGILASCYHLANGFWAAAITWGLTVSAGAQRRWGWICFAIFLGTLAAGMTALVSAVTVSQ